MLGYKIYLDVNSKTYHTDNSKNITNEQPTLPFKLGLDYKNYTRPILQFLLQINRFYVLNFEIQITYLIVNVA